MENNQKTEKISFYTERKSALVQASVIFMLLSAIFRLVGCWGRWNDAFFAATQIALPLACNLLFILLVLTLGRRALWTTVLPVLLGVVFFIIKSFTFDSVLHTILCILLYLLVAVLYTGTVFGRIRTKWLLVPLFGLPLLYHIFVEDLNAMRSANPPSFDAGMQEVSVLCIMLSLLLLSIAMKKKKPESLPDLPKMKAPKVSVPGKGEPATDDGDTVVETAKETAPEKSGEK